MTDDQLRRLAELLADLDEFGEAYPTGQQRAEAVAALLNDD